ncbi:MAG: purine-nucleoside phosphorylase [Sulfolobales archaeon]|nr:purine-nucleoside phosphorylase [Sulfolobales archaeon]MCX8198751.1 purine-nucleoside phosphorylase [Sulfolobales archaeon]MDW8169824.1 purine-nucleoside phosphorylase [Desulfurococcaceae archaeon]
MKAPPHHISAKKEDVAEKVIAVGDPVRAVLIKDLLSNPRLVSESRGFLIYTGKYHGSPVSIAVHGIGAPSAAIVFEELGMLGVKTIVRLGSCGSLRRDIAIGSIIVATSAAHSSQGAISQYFQGSCPPNAPDPELTVKIMDHMRRMGIKFHSGPVVSSDAFYAEDFSFAEKWSRRGAIAVEMECSILFSLGWMRGWKTACILIVSNSLVGESGVYLSTEEMRNTYISVSKAILDTLTFNAT